MSVDIALQGLPKRKGVLPVYRLRWVFYWADGKKKFGIWNGASNRFEDTAASINKAGLIYAAIQTEHIVHCGIQTVFECDGHNYASAKWVGAISSGVPIGKWKVDAVKFTPDIIGLSFITREERISVFVDGSVSRRPNTDYEKLFKLREHSV